jgi:hypothetical protein
VGALAYQHICCAFEIQHIIVLQVMVYSNKNFARTSSDMAKHSNSKGKEVKARYKACILYIHGAMDRITKLLNKTGSISFTDH